MPAMQKAPLSIGNKSADREYSLSRVRVSFARSLRDLPSVPGKSKQKAIGGRRKERHRQPSSLSIIRDCTQDPHRPNRVFSGGRGDTPNVVGNPLRIPSSEEGDRKSTRLNSSHTVISYAVF